MQSLHLFLTFFLIFSSFFVFISDNPVHSVLFLILAFCNASSILFIFNVDFLGVLFIIIYVGAIAVLFLFVVMMLNVKIYQNSISNIQYLFLAFFFLNLIIQIYLNLQGVFSFENENLIDIIAKNIDTLGNIDIFGQILYNHFVIAFLISGLILLIAMIGAISLTLTYKNYTPLGLNAKQLSRSSNFIAFFK